jgi:hypothetical protein
MSQIDSPLSTFDYREEFSPFWRGRHRRNRLGSERSVNKLADAPSTISNGNRLCRRHLEGFVNAAKIVVRDVQRDRRNVIVQLL